MIAPLYKSMMSSSSIRLLYLSASCDHTFRTRRAEALRAESISVGGVESLADVDDDDGVRRGRLAGRGLLSCINEDEDGDESFGVDW